MLRDSNNLIAIINIDKKNTVASYEIKNLFNQLEIPYFSFYSENFYNEHYTLENDPSFKYSIDIYPKWNLLSRAFVDLLEANKWETFILIYYDATSGKVKFVLIFAYY